MRYPTFVKDYSKLNDPSLNVKAGLIVSSLTDNADFPAPVPSLTELTALKDAYSAALINAANGDRAAAAQKKQARLDLLAGLRELAINLQAQANGDRVKMATTGLDLASDGSNVPPLEAPKGFQLLDGLNPGELRSVVKGVRQAVMYSHEYTLEPPTENTEWKVITNTYVEQVFTGLPSGTKVYVRVAARGRKNQTAYTNILSRIVQ